MVNAWRWWTQTDAGLAVRIGIGVAIFALLALAEIARKGARESTRWREYSFLVFAVLAAMCYGVINDSITSAISWEYFYYGKGLDETLGPHLPPDAWKLHVAAAVIGMKATWTAGLVIGVAMLIANNPKKNHPRLAMMKLARLLSMIFLIVAACACAGGVIGYLGVPAIVSNDFHQMLIRDEMRPRRFMAVFGIHLGGYVGGLIATIAAVIRIRRLRSLS